MEFEIKSDRVWQVVGNATNDMDEYIVTEKYCNHETLGQLTIRKQGNVLTDYQDGQFIYTQDNLASAVYEIHAAADIATPDRQAPTGIRTVTSLPPLLLARRGRWMK